MGNSCKKCLNRSDEQTSFNQNSTNSLNVHIPNNKRSTQQQYSLPMNKHRSQIALANITFTTELASISQLQADILITFIDRPSAILKNYFVERLGVSAVSHLQQKINQVDRIGGASKEDITGSSSQFVALKINQPFYDVPIKKLIIVQTRVWDGKSNPKVYLTSIIDQTLRHCMRTSSILSQRISEKKEISIALMQMQQILGYNTQDFHKILLNKLLQTNLASSKMVNSSSSANNKPGASINRVVYITKNQLNENKIKTMIKEGQLRISESSLSQASSNSSNYF